MSIGIKYIYNFATYHFSQFSQLLRRGDKSIPALMAQGAGGTLLLHVFNRGSSFVTTILLARTLGAGDYGIFSYAISWTMVLGIFMTLGLNPVVAKNVAIYHEAKDWGRFHGLLRFSFLTVAIGTIVSFFMAMIITRFLHNGMEHWRTTFWLIFLILPLSAFLNIYEGVQQGLNEVVLGLAPSLFIKPIVFIILIVLALFCVPSSMSANFTLSLFAMTAIIVLVAAALLLKRSLKIYIQNARPLYEVKAWAKTAIPILSIGAMYLINSNADVLMLTSMRSPAEAGIYKVAAKGAELIILVFFIINTPLAPIIARLFSMGEMKTLQRVLTKSARISLLLALFIALPLIFFGHWFLLIFGKEFATGKIPLAILSLGQLTNIASGSLSAILIMSGYEKRAALGLTFATILNVLMNAFLIPNWGMTGAAIANAVSTMTLNILLICYVWRLFNIDPTVFGLRS